MRIASPGAADGPAGGMIASGPLADAAPKNWVDRLAPAPLRPWLRLVRADRPIGGWLLLWPCWWSLALAARAEIDPVDPYLLLLFAIGAFAMRSAGCIYNDIIDRDIDAKVARTRGRPLASGQISLGAAIGLALALCLVGLAVLLQFNPFAIALGFGSVGIVLIYPLMKRVTFWPQAFLGIAFSWGALLGWAAIWGSLSLAPMILYFAAICWTIGYDTIYAHQDKEDDALIGLKSTALRFGERTAMWLSLFYGFTLGGLAFSGWLVDAGSIFFGGLLVAAAHLIWQVATLDIDDAQNCLERFRSNNGFGWIVFTALALDVLPVALA
jgi:4-hydroxybenzoate polyprenyltransferase